MDTIKISKRFATCTLDIDDADYHKLRHIVKRIHSCVYNIRVKCVPSSQKGYHLKVFCMYHHCDMCRLVFDDPKRFEYDQFREPQSQNVLFTEKVYHGKKVFVKNH